MRFQLSKSYRAHPELNGYSDEECYKLMMQARARRGDAMWFVPLMLILVVWLAGMAAAVCVALWVHTSRSTAGTSLRFWTDPAVNGIFTWTLLVLGPVSVAIWIVVRRELIMRSVLNHLVRARCPYCLFSLEGLRIDMGAVVCPECGQRIVLEDEGISPDDLMPRQGKAYQTWKPRKQETVELPPIPLEPEAAPEKKKRIKVFGMKRGW